jgi:hypothetical protein
MLRAGEARVGPDILVVILLRPPALGSGSLRQAWASVILRARLLEPVAQPDRLRPDRCERDLPLEYPEVPGLCNLR